MKALLIYIFCFTFFCTNLLTAQEEYNDTTVINKVYERNHLIKKDFDARNIDDLKVTNKHGYVYITSWEEESIQVDIMVNMQTRYESNLEDFLKLVNFEDRRYSRTIHFKTTFSEDFFSNNPFTINYLIKIPARLNLNINNSIGDVKIDSISGNVDLKHSYGNLELTRIAHNKQHKLDLTFTEGLIDGFGDVIANFNNCTLNINRGHKLNGRTNYCMAGISDVHVMDLQTSTDRLTINQVDSLTLKGSHFIGKINDLSRYLFCELEQGQLTVETTSTINEITISNKKVKTTVTIPADVTYHINGDVTNGAFTHPDPQDLQLLRDNEVISFTGKVGDAAEAQANFIIFNEDSSITIKN
jgi:hypothetical protein